MCSSVVRFFFILLCRQRKEISLKIEFFFTLPFFSATFEGNEKHGIPADIIALLDDCVIINQRGVIR